MYNCVRFFRCWKIWLIVANSNVSSNHTRGHTPFSPLASATCCRNYDCAKCDNLNDILYISKTAVVVPLLSIVLHCSGMAQVPFEVHCHIWNCSLSLSRMSSTNIHHRHSLVRNFNWVKDIFTLTSSTSWQPIPVEQKGWRENVCTSRAWKVCQPLGHVNWTVDTIDIAFLRKSLMRDREYLNEQMVLFYAKFASEQSRHRPQNVPHVTFFEQKMRKSKQMWLFLLDGLMVGQKYGDGVGERQWECKFVVVMKLLTGQLVRLQEQVKGGFKYSQVAL